MVVSDWRRTSTKQGKRAGSVYVRKVEDWSVEVSMARKDPCWVSHIGVDTWNKQGVSLWVFRKKGVSVRKVYEKWSRYTCGLSKG
jgi:hypothetical protein